MSVLTESTVTDTRMDRVARKFWDFLKSSVNQMKGRKFMGDVQREIFTESPFEPVLNGLHLIGIGIGGIIGAGIFVLSGNAAANYAGPSLIISFIISGIVAILAALSLSKLAVMIPHSGAVFTYTNIVLGEYMAWFIGWNYALLYQLAAAAVLVHWSKYVVHLIELISGYKVVSMVVQPPVAWNETGLNFYATGQVINLPAVAITIAITILLVSGIRPTAIVNLILVVFKIIILLIFIFACAKHVNTDNYRPFFPRNEGSFSRYGFTGMLQACTHVFFAYVGFESIANVVQEARVPSRISVSVAMISSVVISSLIYIGISTVMVGLVPYRLLNSDNPLAEAIKEATPYGLWLFVLIDLGAIAALTTVALTMILSQTRIFHAMACDGLLPKFFHKISARRHTPWISIIISGVFCAVMSGVSPVDILGETTSISALITYLFVHIELIVMYFTHPDITGAAHIGLGSLLVATIGGIFCIIPLISISKGTAYRFLAWTCAGQVIYFSYGFWHSQKRSRCTKASLDNPPQPRYPVEAIVLDGMNPEVEPVAVVDVVTFRL